MCHLWFSDGKHTPNVIRMFVRRHARFVCAPRQPATARNEQLCSEHGRVQIEQASACLPAEHLVNQGFFPTEQPTVQRGSSLTNPSCTSSCTACGQLASVLVGVFFPCPWEYPAYPSRGEDSRSLCDQNASCQYHRHWS